MLGTRHETSPPPPDRRRPHPDRVRPDAPGTTDKASAVAQYQAMAEQVARDRWGGRPARWRAPPSRWCRTPWVSGSHGHGIPCAGASPPCTTTPGAGPRVGTSARAAATATASPCARCAVSDRCATASRTDAEDRPRGRRGCMQAGSCSVSAGRTPTAAGAGLERRVARAVAPQVGEHLGDLVREVVAVGARPGPRVGAVPARRAGVGHRTPRASRRHHRADGVPRRIDEAGERQAVGRPGVAHPVGRRAVSAAGHPLEHVAEVDHEDIGVGGHARSSRRARAPRARRGRPGPAS